MLVTVYSDSNIRIWYYNYEENSFKLCIDGYYQTCCILNVRLVNLQNNLYVMIGSTNGHIAIYDITSNIQKYFEIHSDHLIAEKLDFEKEKLTNLIANQQLHQSAIKSFDIRRINESSIQLITGGDDNALVLSSISKNNADTPSLHFTVSAFEKDAASATITSVNFINDEEKVFATSVDQSLKVWSVQNDKLQLLRSEYTTVADTGCSTVTKFADGTTLALIGGSGFSSWRL
ncbi:unnamed protein product [Ambrosiozyma monospora]|uniref:Unnamed protein product n=1 Tax=Ambrosiozyma monospora TaxID=43982 RepID=A0ACB5T249_AMBMO|nr:unnamed protein product [Ambrosiozyma monospora]